MESFYIVQFTEPYTCKYCHNKYGHRRIKKHQRDFVCDTCPSRLAKLKELVRKSKIKCICQKTHAPGKVRDECLVNLDYRHVKWPGSDEGLILKDFRFLQSISKEKVPRWWAQARGPHKYKNVDPTSSQDGSSMIK